jgi:hypothetical protein
MRRDGAAVLVAKVRANEQLGQAIVICVVCSEVVVVMSSCGRPHPMKSASGVRIRQPAAILLIPPINSNQYID